MTVPQNWNRFDARGIDSYVGGIITDTKDTLMFDYGWYSGDVTRNHFPMVYDSVTVKLLTKKERELLPNTKHLIVDSITGDIDLSNYTKYLFAYDSIDCYRAKFIVPRNKGYGATGIYIDSISGSKEQFNKTKFSFYGWYLKPTTHNQFLEALKTLKFPERCN